MKSSEILGVVEGAPEGAECWRFRVLLSDGRRFEELLHRPDLPSWLRAHLRAFEQFGGVPPTLELSSLPPGLSGECASRAWADLLEYLIGAPRGPGENGLLPLPERPYLLPSWKSARLHPDCHVAFEGALYSAPYRLIGRRLVVRGTRDSVDLFDRDQWVAHHPRADRVGERRTNPAHAPPPEVAALLPAPRRLRHDAARLGPALGRLVEALLEERPVEGLRGAQGVLHLVRRYGILRVEEACRRAIASGRPSYRAVRHALEKGIDDHGQNRIA